MKLIQGDCLEVMKTLPDNSVDTVVQPTFDYIKCPLHRYTFSIKPIREWVESNCEGKTLNLFAGKTKLKIDEIRNDLDIEALSDYKMDALEFLRTWQGEKFSTVLLDPPYAYRKSMEMYKGIRCSPFKQLKDEIVRVLEDDGRVITFGYHSNSMGKKRGFRVERIALFSHGGAIHDTIATVERFGTGCLNIATRRIEDTDPLFQAGEVLTVENMEKGRAMP